MHGICENQAIITDANIMKGEWIRVSHYSMIRVKQSSGYGVAIRRL